jgi:hypothetical protein
MTTEQRRSRLDSIGLSQTERNGLKELVTETLLRNSNRRQWENKSVEEQEAWMFDLAQLIKEEGLHRVCAGMRATWTRISYLASPAEVRKHFPPPEAVKPVATHTHDPHCADCSGSGWKDAIGYSYLHRLKTRGVVRCDCTTRPHTMRKPDSAADKAFIAAMVAELDAKLGMDHQSPRKPAPCATPVIPIVQFTADQIQRRKPVERAEIHDVEDKLIQARNGTYEPGPRS